MTEFNTITSIPIDETKSLDINDTTNSIPVKEGECSEERIQWLHDRGVLIEFPELLVDSSTRTSLPIPPSFSTVSVRNTKLHSYRGP
jgi:hypothetical protein